MQNRKKLFLLILIIVYLVIWFLLSYALPNNFLKIVFFDVGQGDAIFIETVNHRQILIDGGPDKLILDKLNQEMPFWDRHLDLVILTHPDADHLTGLISVLEYFQIGQILTSGLNRDTAAYQRWKKIIQEKQIPIVLADLGQEIVLDEEVSLKVLWPDQDLIGEYSGKANNVSVVAKIIYQDAEFLLPGDIERKIEKRLIDYSAMFLESDLLKVAHHGSRTSSIKEFVQMVNPEIAVISVGKDNYYGHPSQEVIDRLKDLILLRTDQCGDIRVLTNGEKLWIELEKKP